METQNIQAIFPLTFYSKHLSW